MAKQSTGGFGRILAPHNTLPRSYSRFLAFDTETDSVTGRMKCACLYGDIKSLDGNRVVRVEQTFYDVESLNHYIMSIGDGVRRVTTIVCFNLSFDVWYLFKSLDLDSVLMNGSRFIVAKTKNNLEMIDIRNHSGGSLGDWVKIMKLEERGIYKTEHPEEMEMEELVDHCKMDARATWELAEYFKKFYQDLGVSMKLTLSSSALDMFRRNFLTQKWMRVDGKEKNGKTLSEMEKLAYYGGRTEVFTRGISDVQSYDVNSMYVSVMKDEWYPQPDQCTFYSGDNAKGAFKHFFNNKNVKPNLMIVHCRVKAPKSRVMVLPYRGKDKLLFPWGEFEGWWTSPELITAIEYGYEILEVKEFILYRKPVKIFAGYADFCYGNRLRAQETDGKGSAFDYIWKLMGNGVYGKFGEQHPVGGGFSETMPLSAEGQLTKHVIVDGRDVYISSTSEEEFALTAFPCIAAFVTSYSRLKLLKYLKRHEGTVVYCDTDSVKYPSDEPPESWSKVLGDVKYEPEHSGRHIFLRPKMYGKCYDDFDDPIFHDYDFYTPNGQVITISKKHLEDWKIKGLGKPLGVIINCDKTMNIEGLTLRVTRFRQALKGGDTPNKFFEMNKMMDMRDDKRDWKGKDSLSLYIHE